MNVYELVNPSDPYTFIAPDDEVAALVAFMLGTGYGAKLDGDVVVPVFLLGGAEEWYTARFGRSIADGVGALKEQMAESLCSMLYGSAAQRRECEDTLSLITDTENRAAFLARWHDKRSSMNDIGKYARNYGKIMLKVIHEEADSGE